MKKLAILFAMFLLFPAVGNGNVSIQSEDKFSFNLQHSFQTAISNESIKLVHPMMAHPVIVDKNTNFTILISSPAFDNVSVSIETAYNSLADIYKLKVEKIWGERVWHIVVNSGNAAYELYNLSVILSINGNRYELHQPKAVAIEKIKGNFSFVHLTDFHIGDPRGMSVSVIKTIGWRAAKKSIEEINLLHPSFVIITGDLVFGQLYPFEYTIEYKKLYEILLQFRVPIFLCPGNHDGYVQSGQDGFKLWKEYFGWLNYSFDYGDAHFLIANSYDWPFKMRRAISYAAFNWGGYIGDEQLKWIEKDLERSHAKLKVMALHHNPLWDTSNDSLFGNGYHNREKLLNIIFKNGVDAVLDGHVHYDDVEKVNGTIFITTTTVASSLSSEDAYWGYRLIKVRNWSIVSYNYKPPKFSIPLYHINSTVLSNEAKIENNLDIPINVTLSFYVSNETHSIENGKIIMERMKGNEKELYVEAIIPANSEVRVKVE